MNAGRIEQIGTPDEVYDQPVSPFVLEFLGHVNRFPSGVDGDALYARPHEIAVLKEPATDALRARLDHRVPLGPYTRLEFVLDGNNHPVNVEIPREQSATLRPGDIAYLRPLRLRRFAEASASA
jgi:sulfate transport system ATP-binding protein